MSDDEIEATDPATRRGLIIMGVVIALVVLVSLFVGLISYVANRPKQSKPVVARVVDPAMQQKRQSFIAEAERLGVFAKVDNPGSQYSFVDVWVGPSFYTLTFDEKSTYIGVVSAYYFEGTGKSIAGVRIFDNYSGKQIGAYHEGTGLQLY
jgi:hypothetical protein